MQFTKFYEQVSWLLKQEPTSSVYSLAEIADVVDVFNRLSKELIDDYPEKFRKLVDVTLTPVAPATTVATYTPEETATVFSVRINDGDWTVPVSFNAPYGEVKMFSEDTMLFEPALEAGTKLTLDCSQYIADFSTTSPTPVGHLAITAEIPLKPAVINIMLYKVCEQVAARNGMTLSEEFYRAFRAAFNNFVNKKPTFRQQTAGFGPNVSFGR